MQLTYAIKFVANMDAAVAFYRDRLGLREKFASPDWSEFQTGETTLALHIASDANPAGSVQLGFGSDDLDAFHAAAVAAGLDFTAPIEVLHGTRIARLRDADGAEISVSGR
jgi:catechol 2,3-dioxygenase-like lactoylglutathione lyase family enzyme